MKRIPKWTLAIAAASLVLQVWPGAFEALRYDQAQILAGEWWRLLTGHMTHASWKLWTWNVLAFLILGVQAERRLGRKYLPLLGFGALAIGAGVLVSVPSLDWYCGLSGIDTALFGYLLGADGIRAWRDGDRVLIGVNAFGLCCVAGKITYEYVTGQVLFAYTQGLPPVPAAHLLGAMAGVAFLGLAARPGGLSSQRKKLQPIDRASARSG